MDRRSILKSALLGAGAVTGAASAPAQAATESGARSRRAPLAVQHEGAGSAPLLAALAKIAAYADAHRRGYGLPGLTLVCTAPGGFTAYVRSGYAEVERQSPLRADHLFQIGSISKSFVAMAVHQLAAEGRLSLTDDIRKILPGVALPPEPPISLVNLMEHSSGLPDGAPLFPRVGDNRLWSAFPPGTAWSYSNTAYDLLGKVVEHLDNRPLARSLEMRILKPLGMTGARGEIIAAERTKYAAGYNPLNSETESHPGGKLGPGPWVNVTFGAGCVAATSRDMALWIRYLAAAGAGKGAPLLTDEGAKRYAAPGIAAPGWAVVGAHYGAGLAHVPVEGRTLLHHTGGMVTFSSSIHVDPIAGVGCFASTNCGMQDYRPRELTAHACALLRAAVAPEAGLAPKPAPIRKADVPVKPPTPAGAVDPALAALAGRYESDDPWQGSITLAALPSGLTIDGQVALDRHADGYWIPRAPVSTERFWFGGVLGGRPQVLSISGNEFVRRDL